MTLKASMLKADTKPKAHNMARFSNKPIDNAIFLSENCIFGACN
jgi:hypothetical protein